METKILVVDDHLETWQILSAMLRSQGFHPVWAADGLNAMSEARKQHPHVVILDLGLPGGDGFIVLERLKANRLLSDIPIIVVTALDAKTTEARALEHGAAAFLQKPVKPDELIATIHRVLKQKT